MDYANAMGLVQLIDSLGSSENTDSFGNTPLHQACYNGQSEMIKTMLAKDHTTINTRNDEKMTPLHVAVSTDNILISELLLEAGADTNISGLYGNSPLHTAAKNNNEYLVKKLLMHNASIDERNEAGETALIIASRNGSNYIVGTLLEHGAAVSYVDKAEHTALYYATENGNSDIVEKLLLAGAEE